MGNKLDIFERRMININGDLQERVVYQRHMAEDIFLEASGVIDEALLTVASGILSESFVLADTAHNVPNPHYIYSLDVNIIPSASGTQNTGTRAVPFAEGVFDSVVASNGWNGAFLTNDGRTAIVTQGIITGMQ